MFQLSVFAWTQHSAACHSVSVRPSLSQVLLPSSTPTRRRAPCLQFLGPVPDRQHHPDASATCSSYSSEENVHRHVLILTRRLRSFRSNFLPLWELRRSLLHPVSVVVRSIHVMIWFLSLDTSPYLLVNRTPPCAIVVLDQPTFACAPLRRELLEMPPVFADRVSAVALSTLHHHIHVVPSSPTLSLHAMLRTATSQFPVPSILDIPLPCDLTWALVTYSLLTVGSGASTCPSSPCTPHLASLPSAGMRSPPTPGMGLHEIPECSKHVQHGNCVPAVAFLTVLALTTPFGVLCHHLITLHP